MKIQLLLYSLLITVRLCFADVPLDDNGNQFRFYSETNYLPWVIGVLAALGIMVFMYIYKKETHE